MHVDATESIFVTEKLYISRMLINATLNQCIVELMRQRIDTAGTLLLVKSIPAFKNFKSPEVPFVLIWISVPWIP